VPGVDHDASRIDASGCGPCRLNLKECRDRTDDIGVLDAVRTGARYRATGVGAHHPNVMCSSDVYQLWVVATPRVVQKVCTSTTHSVGHLVSPGVHAHNDLGIRLPNRRDELNSAS